MTQKICFVVMGFGKKTDYELGRTLDLDATYDAIIKPAVTDQGIRCVRADEIMHAGTIDSEMYEMLLRADLVIADISTGNVNAVYELGVRHALRPNSTIIMKETVGRLYFDLNHTSTFQYEHLGIDIGAREAVRAKRNLGLLIAEVMASQKPDSPVYTYLPKLQQPRMTDAEFAGLLDEVEASEHELSDFLSQGAAAVAESNFGQAVVAFENAAKVKPDDAYILQQLALATYKLKLPSELEALMRGLAVLKNLNIEFSNDPETLGIAGAIRKRLWLLTSDSIQLDIAIKHYGRGFEVRRDYYTGENLAACFDMRSQIQPDDSERQFDKMSAKKVRIAILEQLHNIISAPTFTDRTDRKWIHATMANCSFALGDDEKGRIYETAFLEEKPAQWEIETYQAGKEKILKDC